MNYLDYKEKLTHGSFEFPFAFYSVSPIHPRYNMVEHWHKEYELIRIISGSLSLSLDGEHQIINTGDICFIARGVLHGGIPASCTYECLLFDLSAILEGGQLFRQESAALGGFEKRIQQCFPVREESTKQIVAQMLDCMKAQPEGYRFMVLGGLYLFLGAVMQSHSYEAAATRKNSATRRLALFKDVLSLIRDHYQEPLTLDALAACANMNKKYFCRFFREITQRSPMEYLNYYRIEIACEQLAATNKNISEIAWGCGFNDVSYFTKVFRKYKGVTPSQYVKKNLC